MLQLKTTPQQEEQQEQQQHDDDEDDVVVPSSTGSYGILPTLTLPPYTYKHTHKHTHTNRIPLEKHVVYTHTLDTNFLFFFCFNLL